MTKPQIDLMLHDQPVVDYKTGKKEKGKGKDYTNVSIADKAAKALAALEEARANGGGTLESLGEFGDEVKL